MADQFDSGIDAERFTDRDHPLIYSCRAPGFAEAIGMKPQGADQELVLDIFLTNLAMAGEAEKPLSYSRHRGHYRRSRYRPPAFTYTHAMRAVAKVVDAGLGIENRTLPGHRGWQSTITATPLLMSCWNEMAAAPVYDDNTETIILKSRDEEKRLLEYIDAPLTRGLREEIGPINEMLRGTDIGVPGATKRATDLLMFEELGWDEYDRPLVTRHYVRLTDKAGRRIFAGDFEHHGRFYCSAQNIPSDARSTMTINGEPCAELDFSAMHPTLAYNIAGVQMDGDPYDLGDTFERRQVKLGLLIVMNARDPVSAARALARHGRQLGINHDKAKAIVKAILKRHDAIGVMLCNDWGIKLMNLDARIMVQVMNALVARGIPCIGIHDSIVVQRRFEGQAFAEMEKSSAKNSKGPNLCNIKRKSVAIPHMGRSRGPVPTSEW
jgi:hypothetical protein